MSPRKAWPQPCSQDVSPIKWDNVILYGQYVLDRARGALRNGSLCCISTRMWALPFYGEYQLNRSLVRSERLSV